MCHCALSDGNKIKMHTGEFACVCVPHILIKNTARGCMNTDLGRSGLLHAVYQIKTKWLLPLYFCWWIVFSLNSKRLIIPSLWPLDATSEKLYSYWFTTNYPQHCRNVVLRCPLSSLPSLPLQRMLRDPPIDIPATLLWQPPHHLWKMTVSHMTSAVLPGSPANDSDSV